MIIAAFASFLVLVAAWLLAANAEGAPETHAEPAARLVEVQPTA